jgi:tungstate transport system substrate-binding protein
MNHARRTPQGRRARQPARLPALRHALRHALRLAACLAPVLAAVLASAPALTGCGGPPAGERVVLGATHTVEDAGLLPVLLAAFAAAEPGVRVSAWTAATGQVLEAARRGDVDVVVSHDPVAEAALVAAGHAAERRELMWNDFVLAGPAEDPAGARLAPDAARALARIAAAGAGFVSRADDSGTHRRERELWDAAGLRPEPRARWYLEAGVGMGEALLLASARRAYILTDRATLLHLGGALGLEVLVEGDPALLNRYGVLLTRRGATRDGAAALAAWLTGAAGQATIAGYGAERFGAPLFHPGAGSHPVTAP